jgi:hypothetical protein
VSAGLDPKPGAAGIFIGLGGLLLVVGIVWHFAGPFLSEKGWIPGKLPGDIAIERENFRFYFPITTSILASILLGFLFKLFQSFGGK